ncbi:MAG: hypothetical protein HWE23_01555 [Rhodobacteraceae bacterium]|nr:hypothetical protein [Paracoccaceae bacterium]
MGVMMVGSGFSSSSFMGAFAQPGSDADQASQSKSQAQAKPDGADTASAASASDKGSSPSGAVEADDRMKEAVARNKEAAKLIEQFRQALDAMRARSGDKGSSFDAEKFADLIIHVNSGNTVETSGGDDEITANSENIINAGEGSNRVHANASNMIATGEGDDEIGANAENVIDAGDGNNSIFANASNQITTGSGHDAITINAGNQLDSGGGNDVIRANADNIINSGSGDDLISVNSNNVIDAGSGDDVIQGNAENVIRAGAGNDRVNMGGGEVEGGAGDDELTLTRDTIVHFNAGDGHDTISTIAAKIDLRLGAGLSPDNMQVSYETGSPTISFNDGAESMTFSAIALSDVTLTFANGKTMKLDEIEPTRVPVGPEVNRIDALSVVV